MLGFSERQTPERQFEHPVSQGHSRTGLSSYREDQPQTAQFMLQIQHKLSQVRFSANNRLQMYPESLHTKSPQGTRVLKEKQRGK